MKTVDEKNLGEKFFGDLPFKLGGRLMPSAYTRKTKFMWKVSPKFGCLNVYLPHFCTFPRDISINIFKCVNKQNKRFKSKKYIFNHGKISQKFKSRTENKTGHNKRHFSNKLS